MRKSLLWMALAVLATGTTLHLTADSKTAGAEDWAMNATLIESCSCPMFCQCYFNPQPAGHAHHGGGAEHYCRFNNTFRVNHGHYGKAKLDGAKFWLSGDLGGDFSKGQMDWAVLTFDPSVTPEQREGITKILGHLYPVKWNSFTTAADAPMDWQAAKDRAHAKLAGGKAGEVILKRPQGNTNDPIVIHNLKYWGAPRNDGFVLMPNEVNAYRLGDKAFETKGTNGFMITVDISSKDVKSATGM